MLDRVPGSLHASRVSPLVIFRRRTTFSSSVTRQSKPTRKFNITAYNNINYAGRFSREMPHPPPPPTATQIRISPTAIPDFRSTGRPQPSSRTRK